MHRYLLLVLWIIGVPGGLLAQESLIKPSEKIFTELEDVLSQDETATSLGKKVALHFHNGNVDEAFFARVIETTKTVLRSKNISFFVCEDCSQVRQQVIQGPNNSTIVTLSRGFADEQTRESLIEQEGVDSFLSISVSATGDRSSLRIIRYEEEEKTILTQKNFSNDEILEGWSFYFGFMNFPIKVTETSTVAGKTVEEEVSNDYHAVILTAERPTDWVLAEFSLFSGNPPIFGDINSHLDGKIDSVGGFMLDASYDWSWTGFLSGRVAGGGGYMFFPGIGSPLYGKLGTKLTLGQFSTNFNYLFLFAETSKAEDNTATSAYYLTFNIKF